MGARFADCCAPSGAELIAIRTGLSARGGEALVAGHVLFRPPRSNPAEPAHTTLKPAIHRNNLGIGRGRQGRLGMDE
jgi:hypothetical protein